MQDKCYESNDIAYLITDTPNSVTFEKKWATIEARSKRNYIANSIYFKTSNQISTMIWKTKSH